MNAHVTTEYRLLGFDTGDWTIMGIGIALVALLLLLV
jgi:energy-coupling factor transporter transmembrane protein EcfT